jgi:hypothetical protein
MAVKLSKAIPVTGRGGPQGCETSRLPHFLGIWLTDGGDVLGLKRLPPFTPGITLTLAKYINFLDLEGNLSIILRQSVPFVSLPSLLHLKFSLPACKILLLPAFTEEPTHCIRHCPLLTASTLRK